MDPQEIQDWATENSLDVRIMQIGRMKLPNHMRMMDEYGNYKIDVYVKRTKAGKIIKNTVFIHKKEIWTVANTIQELATIYNKYK